MNYCFYIYVQCTRTCTADIVYIKKKDEMKGSRHIYKQQQVHTLYSIHTIYNYYINVI